MISAALGFLPDTSLSPSVADQLTRMIYRNSRRVLLPVVVSGSLCYALALESGLIVAATIWFAVAVAATVLRTFGLGRLSRNHTRDPSTQLLLVSLLSLLTGMSVGSILFFFPFMGAFERAMLTAMLLSFCTGAVVANAGYRPIFFCYVLPIFLPMMLLWAFNPGAVVAPGLALHITVALLFMLFTLAYIAQVTFDAFAAMLTSSERHADLAADLSEALEAMRTARAAAETSSQSKTRFIAAASHDLRQPVHVLSMYGAVLSRVPVDEKTRSMIDNMNIAVESLSSQLSSLLDLSRLDSAEIEPDFSNVDLAELCGTLLRDLDQIASNQHITMNNELQAPLFVRSDRDMLMRILQNLVGNALKYTRSGSVTLRTVDAGSEAPDEVVLQIVDTGVGIAEAEQMHIFDEFYQVDNARRDSHLGLGLGLSIVQRLIRSLEHGIEVRSVLGEGTTISVTLPRSQEACASASAPHGTTPAPASNNQDSGIQVHIVDDDRAICDSMGELLREQGYRVTSSSGLADTRRVLERQLPQLLLVDLCLEDDASGLDVIDWAQCTAPGLPAMLITGEAIVADSVLEARPDLCLLQKPIAEDTLLHEINRLVAPAAAAPRRAVNDRRIGERQLEIAE